MNCQYSTTKTTCQYCTTELPVDSNTNVMECPKCGTVYKVSYKLRPKTFGLWYIILTPVEPEP